MFRRQKKNIIRLIFLLTFAILLVLFLEVRPLEVKEVVVNTEYDLTTNKEILDFLNKLKGKNIFLVKEKETEQRFSSLDFRIKRAGVKKNFLGKIIITITARRPLAVISQDNGHFLIDEEGYVLGKEISRPELPILNISLQNSSLGSRIENGGEKLLETLSLVLKFEKVNEIVEDQEGIKIRLTSGTNIILPSNDEARQDKINALQMVLSRFRIEGRSPVKIDMRFEKPVVSF